MKKAILITFSLTTRVIVEDGASDDVIIAAAYKGIQDKIDNRELGDNCTEIENDFEVPFGEVNNEFTCLNCGSDFVGLAVMHDALGKHSLCPDCGSTSDKL